jgi:hypothetical protein
MVVAWLSVRAAVCSWVRRSVALALVLIGSLVLSPSAVHADLQAVYGSAFGEQTDVLDGAITSGPLPSATVPDRGGGPVTDSATSVCVPVGTCRILRAGALRASTRGSLEGAGSVAGSAAITNVDVARGVVTGDAMRSQCGGDAGGLRGAAQLTNVKVGGLPVMANPAPNTVVTVTGIARVTLNEQIVAADSVTVNAVHVELLSGDFGDVVLPQAHCDVTAAVPASAGTALPAQLALLTMAVLMGAAVVAWRRDPFMFRRSGK